MVGPIRKVASKGSRQPCHRCDKLVSSNHGGIQKHDKICKKNIAEDQRRERQRAERGRAPEIRFSFLEKNNQDSGSDSDSDSSVEEELILGDYDHNPPIGHLHQAPHRVMFETVDDGDIQMDDMCGSGATLNVPNDPNRINTPEPEQSIRKPYVRTEYHPFSQRADEYTPLDEYFAATPRVHSRDPNVPGAGSSSPPESPFESYPDFSFAEWITCARLSAPEVNSLLGLMKNVWTSGSSNISFNSYQDILKVFDPMDPVTVPFEDKTFSCEYEDHKGVTQTENFTIQVRSPLACFRELAKDPEIASQMSWYPCRRYLSEDGHTEVQMRDDVECGSDWWEIQNEIGRYRMYSPGMFYLDGTQIARFGRVSFTPVLYFVGSLASAVRNGNRYGGAILIGYIPKIHTPKSERRNKRFKVFKREVRHRSWKVILACLVTISTVGETMTCGDQIPRTLVLGVYILFLDFEEQSDTVATRGPNALFPCTICMVPQNEQATIGKNWKPRTGMDSQNIYLSAQRLISTPGMKAAGEKLLKNNGMRLVDNAFWGLGYSDPHRALSFDVSHWIEGGSFVHLFEATIDTLSNFGDDVAMLAEIDRRFSLLPPWNGHRSLREVTDTTFADHKKWLSVYVRILPCIFDLVPAGISSREMHKVYKAFRLLAEIRMIAGIEVITDKHIKHGRSLVEQFGKLLPTVSKILNKNLMFPKIHMILKHLFDHIERKGPTKNFSTTIGEHKHVGFKSDYQYLTNGRNFEKQITKLHQRRMDFEVIRRRIEQSGEPGAQSLESRAYPRRQRKIVTEFPSPGSPQRKERLVSFQLRHQRDAPFRNFTKELYQFLTYMVYGPAGTQKIVSLDATNGMRICPFNNVKIQYRSLSSQKLVAEYLRCAESFHNRPRYDNCIVRQSDGTLAVVRLHLIFSCEAAGKRWNLARVRLLKLDRKASKAGTGMNRYREERFGFIDLSWIIRSVFLSRLPTKHGEYFLNDLVDSEDDPSDIYLRIGELSKEKWY